MKLAAVVLAMAATTASADSLPTDTKQSKPDQSAVDAGEANLEPITARKGIVFTFAIGGAITLGFGNDDNPFTVENRTGRGAAATLRLAHVASPRTMVAVEITGGALFYSIGPEGMTERYQTEFQSFLLGAQFYIQPAVWIRMSAGLGRHFAEAHDDTMGCTGCRRDRFRMPGPAGSAGAGIDILRWKRLRVGLEFTSTASINRAGLLSSSGLLLGLSLD